jgi:hypothetical protein
MSDVLVWFGFQTVVLVWFQLVLVPESSNQNQNHGAGFGLVWFGFGLNHGLSTFYHQEVQAHIVKDF